MDKGYTLKDVAAITGLKVRTVRQWVHDGKLDAYKPKGGKQWVVLESEIRRLQHGDEN